MEWGVGLNEIVISKLDHTDPTNTTGDFLNRDPLPQNGRLHRGHSYNGQVYATVIDANSNGLWRLNPADWDDVTDPYGNTGALVSGFSSTQGITQADGAFFVCDHNSIAKIDPANPGSELGDFGEIMGGIPSGSGNLRGMEADVGETNRPAYITAASGIDAGFPVAITVDNDAAAGGWGARMLAFA